MVMHWSLKPGGRFQLQCSSKAATGRLQPGAASSASGR
jgi:hypothetical protein